MALGFDAIVNAVASHASATGLFEAVNGHEPKSAPQSGIVAAVWVDRVAPLAGASGLASTTGLITLNVRIYTSMLAEPQDAIDPAVVDAVDKLMTAYSGDFELGGNVRNIDLLGQGGTPMQAQAGYVSQDNKLFRVMTITLPLIVNDLWAQSP